MLAENVRISRRPLFTLSLSLLSTVHPVISLLFTSLLLKLFNSLRLRLMVHGSTADMWWYCFYMCVCVGVGSADGWRVIIRCVCASNVCDIAANTSGFLFIDGCFQKRTHQQAAHTHRCVASSHFSVPVNRFNRSHAASSRDCLFVAGHTSSCQQNDSDL